MTPIREADYKDRMVFELVELIKKYKSLDAFFQTKKFRLLPRKKKTLLYKQFRIMNQYIEVLGERLEVEGVDINDYNVWGDE